MVADFEHQPTRRTLSRESQATGVSTTSVRRNSTLMPASLVTGGPVEQLLPKLPQTIFRGLDGFLRRLHLGGIVNRNRLAVIERTAEEPLLRGNGITQHTVCLLETRAVICGQVPLVAPCRVTHVTSVPRPCDVTPARSGCAERRSTSCGARFG